jgi:hypothetical protein
MKLQIIAEGPSDRKLLRALIGRISKGIDIEVIEESKTQMKRRGKQSILLEYDIFAKFLHHGYSKQVDIIVICVDNNGESVQSGVNVTTKNKLNRFIENFKIKNKERYSTIDPEFVIAIPVQTMDYWMKGVDEPEANRGRIRKIEDINKDNIKSETYGAQNVFGGWIIDEKEITKKIEKIKNDHLIVEKLRCFPSFLDFEEQFKTALKL